MQSDSDSDSDSDGVRDRDRYRSRNRDRSGEMQGKKWGKYGQKNRASHICTRTSTRTYLP